MCEYEVIESRLNCDIYGSYSYENQETVFKSTDNLKAKAKMMVLAGKKIEELGDMIFDIIVDDNRINIRYSPKEKEWKNCSFNIIRRFEELTAN